MNVHFPVPRRTWPSLLVNIVVVVVVLALAADAFVLSYSGVHAIVVQAGVSARLARYYPGLFDAVFVIACVAAVMLRDARWWARWYAWLVILLMVAVVGAADAEYAMNVSLPHRTIEGVVAAAPWVLVLLGFGLMLTMLRQSRAQHAPAAAPAGPAYQAPGPAELPEAASAQETRGLPIGVWKPLAEQEPEGVRVLEDVPAAEAAAVPQEEAAEPAEAAVVDEYAAEPDATDVRVAQETDADARAAADTGPVEPVEEAPVMAAAADEEPPSEPEPAVEPAPEPHPEPVAVGNGEGAAVYAAHQDDATPTTPYNYWDSGADSGFNAPDRVPTVSGEVIDEDAPPFATAPFAAVPRLNRVRSTPTPPEGDDEQE